jgi:hypothetical protein
VPLGEADIVVGFSGGSCDDGVSGAAQPFGRFAVIMATCHEGKPGKSYGAESVLSHEIAHLFGAFHPAISAQSVLVLGGGPPDLFDDQNARVIRLMRGYDFRRGIMTLDEPTRRAWRAIYAEGHQRNNEANPLVSGLRTRVWGWLDPEEWPTARPRFARPSGSISCSPDRTRLWAPSMPSGASSKRRFESFGWPGASTSTT